MVATCMLPLATKFPPLLIVRVFDPKSSMLVSASVTLPAKEVLPVTAKVEAVPTFVFKASTLPLTLCVGEPEPLKIKAPRVELPFPIVPRVPPNCFSYVPLPDIYPLFKFRVDPLLEVKVAPLEIFRPLVDKVLPLLNVNVFPLPVIFTAFAYMLFPLELAFPVSANVTELKALELEPIFPERFPWPIERLPLLLVAVVALPVNDHAMVAEEVPVKFRVVAATLPPAVNDPPSAILIA